ncbi:hypothetical protein LCGC14_1352970 [marine sediment metagenome]|uniref:Uncharacterized protein n=1 Tax=marine sediment metagenome TaxID=412755 RepID=A0A0F9MR01_9ZZZZ
MPNDSYSDKLQKMTPSYIIGFFSFAEGALSAVMLSNPELVFPNLIFSIISIICISSVIVAVGALIYKNEIHRKNKKILSRITSVVVTTGIYVVLVFLRIFGIVWISAFFQFFIGMWVILTPQFIEGIPYVSFKITDLTGKEIIHTCDPNSLDYKKKDGEKDLIMYHTPVYFNKTELINRFTQLGPNYEIDTINAIIVKKIDDKQKWKIHYVTLTSKPNLIWVYLGDIGNIYYGDQSIWGLENVILT